MRHQVRKRNFGRRPEQRKALMRGLADQLLQHERIETTLMKAKELRKVVEPLITLGKKGDLHSRRQAAAVLYKKETLQKLFDSVADRFKERPGGYTRIFRSVIRKGDNAPMAIIELIPEGDKPVKKKAKKPAVKKAAPKKAEVNIKKADADTVDYSAITKEYGYSKKIVKDDLKLVEGIGPKIEELFHNAGVKTWEALSQLPLEKCKEVLATGGDRYKMHDPTTWGQQALMAFKGQFKELKILQDELDGGKVETPAVETKKED